MKKTFIMTLKLMMLAIAILSCSCASVNAASTGTLAIETSLVPGPLAVDVIVPEGYPDDTRFPVVYMLNGYDGNNKQWGNIQKRLPQLADTYGMIMVMPDGRDSWYWDAPADPSMKMESFIIEELVPYIDANYPTIPDAGHRAITGLSMGGHGALWLAMRHSEVFKNAGSMSGGVNIANHVGKWKTPLRLGNQEANRHRWTEYSVMNQARNLKPGELNITFDCGIDDFFAGDNEALHRALVAAKVPHDYTSRPGNHSRAYWANSILYHLLYFNERFKEASAQ